MVNSTLRPLTGLFLFLSLVFFLSLGARNPVTDSIPQPRSLSPQWEFSGFVDAFYAADILTNNKGGNRIQPFLFNHNRHNAFNVNLAMLKVRAESDYYRAVVHLQTGTYAIENYATEPALLQGIYEAYAGIALNVKKTIWLDMGVFESHIGYESAISIHNETLTRSMTAENSPYFVTGARFSYRPKPNLLLRAVLTNGWQRIQRSPAQSWPSFGTQIQYTSDNGITLNWSTYFTAVYPGNTERKKRFYNNIFLRQDLPGGLSYIIGVDIGRQEDRQLGQNKDTYTWVTPSALIAFPIASKWRMAARIEGFRDANNSIIAQDFSAWATSINFDYQPTTEVAWRFELKHLRSSDAFIEAESNLIFTTSIAVLIGE
jgi:hypothetical protein